MLRAAPASRLQSQSLRNPLKVRRQRQPLSRRALVPCRLQRGALRNLPEMTQGTLQQRHTPRAAPACRLQPQAVRNPLTMMQQLQSLVLTAAAPCGLQPGALMNPQLDRSTLIPRAALARRLQAQAPRNPLKRARQRQPLIPRAAAPCRLQHGALRTLPEMTQGTLQQRRTPRAAPARRQQPQALRNPLKGTRQWQPLIPRAAAPCRPQHGSAEDPARDDTRHPDPQGSTLLPAAATSSVKPTEGDAAAAAPVPQSTGPMPSAAQSSDESAAGEEDWGTPGGVAAVRCSLQSSSVSVMIVRWDSNKRIWLQDKS